MAEQYAREHAPIDTGPGEPPNDRWPPSGDPSAPTRRAARPKSKRQPSPEPDDVDAGSAPPTPKPPPLISLAAVERKSVAWIWRSWIPAGMLSICDGLPGEGKSTMIIDIAARVTTGRDMPDGSPGTAPGGVLFLGYEDAPGEILRPRFEAVGADLSRVHVHNPESDELFRLGHDSQLEAWIREHEIKLVVIDPLITAMPAKADTHKGQDMRRVLGPVVRTAERTGAAVVGVRHLNKGAGRSALLRGEGSIGIGGTARNVVLVARDPDDPTCRVLARSKGNLAAPAVSLRFAIVDWPGDPDKTGMIDWRGESRHSADDLVAPADEMPRGRVNDATAFLRAALADGPRATAEINAAAQAAGIAHRTLERARAELGVVPTREGRRTVMRLPDAAQGIVGDTGAGPHGSEP